MRTGRRSDGERIIRSSHPRPFLTVRPSDRLPVLCLLLTLAGLGSACAPAPLPHPPAAPLVLLTDFGTRDGAVAAMKGVALSTAPALQIHDLTHEIPPYDIWEGAYRLRQAAPFWPPGTVFVTVVDPGVGSSRQPVVTKLAGGQFVVGPDNGLTTLVADSPGVAAVRVIDAARHRRPGSEASYTFHGRDLFVYVGAQLAAGLLPFDSVGPLLDRAPVRLAHAAPAAEHGAVTGTIPVLDVNYGNVWSDIPRALFETLPRAAQYQVTIRQGVRIVFTGRMPFANTFSDVPRGAPLLYYNSLMQLAVALNMDDFAKRYGIASGPDWHVEVRGAP